jgi:hypothetical protein
VRRDAGTSRNSSGAWFDLPAETHAFSAAGAATGMAPSHRASSMTAFPVSVPPSASPLLPALLRCHPHSTRLVHHGCLLGVSLISQATNLIEAVSEFLLASRCVLANYHHTGLGESEATGEGASRLQAPVARRRVVPSSVLFMHLDAGNHSTVFPPCQSLQLADCGFCRRGPGGWVYPPNSPPQQWTIAFLFHEAAHYTR